MELAGQSRIIVDSQAGPEASTHETEQIRAEWATQRRRIEELEAEIASLRSRTATARQQLLRPPTAESPVPDGGGAHGAWEEEGDRCNRVFVPPEGCGADAGLVGECARCRCEAHGKMVRCNGCGATFHRVCVALMRANRPGTQARTGQPWSSRN